MKKHTSIEKENVSLPLLRVTPEYEDVLLKAGGGKTILVFRSICRSSTMGALGNDRINHMPTGYDSELLPDLATAVPDKETEIENRSTE